MNVSAAVLAIMLCLEAQQHHSSLAEETPTVPFALGFFSFSAHLSPFHLSPCLSYVLQQHLSTINNSAAAAASAFFPCSSASHMPQSVLPGSVCLSRGKRQAFQARENS